MPEGKFGVTTLEPVNQRMQLLDDDLKPELACLMYDNEQQLVRMLR